MVRRRRAACVWNGVSAVGNIPYALARECRFDRAAWGGRARGCVHQFPQTKSQTRRFRRFRVRDRYKRATLSGTTVETEVDRGTGGALVSVRRAMQAVARIAQALQRNSLRQGYAGRVNPVLGCVKPAVGRTDA